MAVMEDGMEMDDILRHLEKHPSPITLTMCWMDTDDSLLHPLKHSFPIALTDDGMVIDDNEGHS